jgi:hypothetical protein
MHDGGVWVHVYGSDLYDNQNYLPPPGGVMLDEGVYAMGVTSLPTLDLDGLIPIPGRDPLEQGRKCYWLTGTVGPFTQSADQGPDAVGDCFLITSTGGMRFLSHLTHRLRATLQPGQRITLECCLSLVAGSDWTVFSLPEEWSWNWRLLDIRRLDDRSFMSDCVIDIEPIDGECNPSMPLA